MAKRRPPNTSDPSAVNRLSELARRYDQRMNMPSAPEAEIYEQVGAIQERQQAALNNPNTMAGASEYAALEERKRGLENRSDIYEAVRLDSANKSYISGVTTAMSGSSLMRDVNSLAGSATTLGQAARIANTPTYQLERQHQAAISNMMNAGGSIVDAVRSDPNNQRAISMLTNQLGAQMTSASTLQAAMALQRRQGLDTESRFLAANASQERIRDYLSAKDLEANVASGRVGNRGDVENQLRADISKIDRFKDAQTRYAGDPEKFERFQRAIDKLTGSAEKAAATLKEMDRQGITGSGGGFSDWMRRNSGNIRAAGQVLNFGADMADMWTFQNPLRERQNQTSFAQIGNRAYDDTLAAMGGDMAAFRRLGAYGIAEQANQSTQTGSRVNTALATGGGVATGLGMMYAGAGMSATGIGAVAGVPTMAVGGLVAAGSLAAGVMNFRQSAGEKGATMSQAELARLDALHHIDDMTTQAFVNHAMGISNATVGLGGLQGAGFTQMTSSAMLDRLAQVGISPAEAVKLTGMGVQTLGGQFNPNQITRAGALQQGGFMSANQFMGSLGQLSMVGGNAAGNMEEILKNAVASGMDSSKAIGMMVDATAALSNRSAVMGVDVTGGSVRTISKMMDELQREGVSANMRGGIAQDAAAFSQAITGDRGLNLNTLARYGQVSSMFGNASRTQRLVLSSLTAEQVASMRGANGADRARELGIDNLMVGADGKIDETKLKALEQQQFEQLTNTIVKRGVSERTRKSLINAGSLEKFEATATADEQRELIAAGILGGHSSRAVLAGVGGRGPNQGVVGTDPQTFGARQAQARAEAERRTVETGRETVDRLGGLDALAGALKDLAGKFDPAAMGKEVKEAAKDFRGPIDKFDKAADKFTEATKTFVNGLDRVSKKGNG